MRWGASYKACGATFLRGAVKQEAQAARLEALINILIWSRVNVTWIKNNQFRGTDSMEVNDLGFVATILFVLVPTVFLLILYIQTASRQSKEDS